MSKTVLNCNPESRGCDLGISAQLHGTGMAYIKSIGGQSNLIQRFPNIEQQIQVKVSELLLNRGKPFTFIHHISGIYEITPIVLKSLPDQLSRNLSQAVALPFHLPSALFVAKKNVSPFPLYSFYRVSHILVRSCM